MARKTTVIFEDGSVPRDVSFNAARAVGKARDITVFLDITASTGTSETLDILIQEESPNGILYTIDTFPQKTGVGAERRILPTVVNAERLQATVTIGGTAGPSFTFTLTAAGSE